MGTPVSDTCPEAAAVWQRLAELGLTPLLDRSMQEALLQDGWRGS